jgi:hypothetical protein
MYFMGQLLMTGTASRRNKGVRMKTVVYRALSMVFGVIALAVGIFALVAGLYAHSYVSGQLGQEKITMPAEASYKTLPQASQDALKPYAGQAMTTGDEAQAFANHYIWEHMSAACTDTTQKAAYTALRSTLFQGDTLRTALLTAYAFWLIGTIVLWIGVIALVVGVALLVLAFTIFKDKGVAPVAPVAETVSVS